MIVKTPVDDFSSFFLSKIVTVVVVSETNSVPVGDVDGYDVPTFLRIRRALSSLGVCAILMGIASKLAE